MHLLMLRRPETSATKTIKNAFIDAAEAGDLRY